MSMKEWYEVLQVLLYPLRTPLFLFEYTSKTHIANPFYSMDNGANDISVFKYKKNYATVGLPFQMEVLFHNCHQDICMAVDMHNFHGQYLEQATANIAYPAHIFRPVAVLGYHHYGYNDKQQIFNLLNS